VSSRCTWSVTNFIGVYKNEAFISLGQHWPSSGQPTLWRNFTHGVRGGNVNILGGHSMGYSCVLFWTVSEIELFPCTVPKLLMRKRYCILFLIPVYCSSDKVGTVYQVRHIFENSTVNINALCNSCEDMACCSSVKHTMFCAVKRHYHGNRSE
jgi:hypothetical protein